MKRALVASVAFALAACTEGDAKQDPKAGGTKGGPLVVAAIVVSPRAVPIELEAVGRTEGSREVQVRARVSGILQAQLFTEGDAVKAGARLFRIERAPFEIELQQARGALAQEIARQEFAQREAVRLALLADQRYISRSQADQADSAARQSAAAVQIAQARVRQAELNLSYTEVDAPISGITGRAQQSIGSLVGRNDESAVLTTLTLADPIWVRFALSEAEYARLRATGERNVEVKLQTADGTIYPQSGKVNFAGSTVDPATGTVQMRAELPNARLQLLPGQYARVRVIAGSQQAILVPQTAVLQNETGRFVWIADAAGKAAQRPVRAGSWAGQDWIILEGLSPGDTVIVDNLARLRPGVAVKLSRDGA